MAQSFVRQSSQNNIEKPLTVAIIIGFQYSRNSNNSRHYNDNQHESSSVNDRGQFQSDQVDNGIANLPIPQIDDIDWSKELYGTIIDMFQAYDFALRFQPDRIAVITDVTHDDKWYKLLGAMRMNIVNYDIQTFIQSLKDKGIYYRYRNRKQMCEIISSITNGAKRVFFYYSGHGQSDGPQNGGGAIELPSDYNESTNHDQSNYDEPINHNESKDNDELRNDEFSTITIRQSKNERPISPSTIPVVSFYDFPSRNDSRKNNIKTERTNFASNRFHRNNRKEDSISSRVKLQENIPYHKKNDNYPTSTEPITSISLINSPSPIKKQNKELINIIPISSPYLLSRRKDDSNIGSLNNQYELTAITNTVSSIIPNRVSSIIPNKVSSIIPKRVSTIVPNRVPTIVPSTRPKIAKLNYSNKSDISIVESTNLTRNKYGGDNIFMVEIIRDLIFDYSAQEAESLFIFDCCYGIDMEFPFVMKLESSSTINYKRQHNHESQNEYEQEYDSQGRFSSSDLRSLDLRSSDLKSLESLDSGNLAQNEMASSTIEPTDYEIDHSQEIKESLEQGRESLGVLHLTTDLARDFLTRWDTDRLNFTRQQPKRRKFWPNNAICISSASHLQESMSTSDGSCFSRFIFRVLASGERSLAKIKSYVDKEMENLTYNTTKNEIDDTYNSQSQHGIMIHTTYPDLNFLWPWLFNYEHRYRVSIDDYRGVLNLTPVS